MSKRKVWTDEDLACKPIDNYEEIFNFLENPPPWRTLCKELTPHSKLLIKNKDLCKHFEDNEPIEPILEAPATFCHFDPEAEKVKRHDEKKLPKTLVCHDMANGYHDDSKIDGTDRYDEYTFYNWAGIDIFCYFSHHLITIPPLGWINTAHAHGVKVIGTVITEWGDGVGFWDLILRSEDDYRTFASALVAIAKTLKFDGWLLNIENKITRPDMLVQFVGHLHKTMHEELTDPLLVWYDSVTITGHLNWQNGLNVKNKAFFDVCDAFFTNYSWTEDDVISSVEAAGDRIHDLFIGMDVWGRNFYGGGQFNLQEAIKVAYDAGCSLAIFAPAWTHETIEPNNDLRVVGEVAPNDRFARFIIRDRALWGSLWPFLNTRVPCQLPFQTSFCRGQGIKRRLYGEVLSPGPWFNLRHMQYQPNAAHGPHGYILSTLENIAKVSRKTLVCKKTGIIKYRDSFLATRMELHSVKSKDKKVNLAGRKDSMGDINEDASDEESENDEEEEEKQENTKKEEDKEQDNAENLVKYANEKEADSKPEVTAEKPRSVKRKMADCLRGIFKRKSLKTEDSQKTQESQKTEELQSTQELQNTPEIKNSEESDKLEFKKESVEFNQVEEMKDDDAGPSWRSGRSLVALSVNLKLGEVDRTRWELAAVPDERECLELYLNDSFIGGSCLKINPSDVLSPEHRFTRLLFCDFKCNNSLIVCVVTKTVNENPDQGLKLVLFMENANGGDLEVSLIGHDIVYKQTLDKYSTGTVHLFPLNTAGEEFKEVQRYLLLNESSFYVPIENCYSWTVRYFEVPVPGSRVSSINCHTTQDRGGILLGHIGICDRRTEKIEKKLPCLVDRGV